MHRLFAMNWKVYLVATVWLTIGWLVSYLSPLDASCGLRLPVWVQIPGAVAAVIGAAGVLTCGVLLSNLGIGTLPGKERLLPKEFLVTGPFAFTRNPMSLAGFVLMLGIALLYRSTFALGLAAVLFVLMHLLVVRVEEPGLEKRFGESYREYKRNVPRWLPRWSAWTRSAVEPGASSDRG